MSRLTTRERGYRFGPDALATTAPGLIAEIAPLSMGSVSKGNLPSPAPYVDGTDNAFVIRERRGT
jgi:hypothetical protein